MKNIPLLLLALTVALPAAAREAGYTYGFNGEDIREAVKAQPAPEAPTTAPIEAAAPAACPVIDLNNAQIHYAGIFTTYYAVKVGDRDLGEVKHDGDGYVYEIGGAAAMKIAVATKGEWTYALVTGCNGEAIGRVDENYSENASAYAVYDGANDYVARSGRVDGGTWPMSGADGVSAQITETSGNHYTMSASGVDSRLVLAAVILNNEALYQRSRENWRNRERGGGRFR